MSLGCQMWVGMLEEELAAKWWAMATRSSMGMASKSVWMLLVHRNQLAYMLARLLIHLLPTIERATSLHCLETNSSYAPPNDRKNMKKIEARNHQRRASNFYHCNTLYTYL
jgi:hypothetical protein